MSFLQTATTSFKVELLQAVHNFGPTLPDTFKIALYTAAANLNADTTVYSTTNEVPSAGTNYTAGGNTLVISTSPTSGNNSANIPTAYISFATTSWALASFTARGALIYNASEGNKSVAVLDFGSDKTATGNTFEILFPTANANSAIVRIS
jgi:hypothetical protein